MTILAVATIVSIGLMIGVEFAVSAFINPILWKLEQKAQSQAVQLFARKLGTVMPFWYGLNLILLIGEAIVLRDRPGVGLLGAAAGIWVAVIVFTLIFLVPINNRLADEHSSTPVERANREHKRWDRMHRARVLALGIAMVLLLFAVHA
jgi:uncharacterized membrane protein